MSNRGHNFEEIVSVKAAFFCPKCKGDLFKVLKGYYSRNPILICNKCNLILTLKELKKAAKKQSGEVIEK